MRIFKTNLKNFPQKPLAHLASKGENPLAQLQNPLAAGFGIWLALHNDKSCFLRVCYRRTTIETTSSHFHDCLLHMPTIWILQCEGIRVFWRLFSVRTTHASSKSSVRKVLWGLCSCKQGRVELTC